MNKVLLAGAAALAMAGCSDTGGGGDPASGDPQTSDYNEDRNAYYGDLHIHTRNSFDAYIFNVRATPDDVYRFARGETVKHPGGYDISLSGPPLDFVAVTDHGAYLGILPELDNDESPLSKLPIAQDMFGTDPEVITAAFQKVGLSVRTGEKIEEIYKPEIMDATWARTVEAAEKHYAPGELTTFAGYEYTAVTTVSGGDGFGGGNLHRNVFFAGEAPESLFTVLDSNNPEDLWDWMDGLRGEGMDSIAIPHNSNVSNGAMFANATSDGSPLTAAYAEQRMLNEPLVEITQVKGTSETHPSLSPNDEWASFEIYEKLLASDITSKTEGGYVRQALGDGMVLESEGKGNPYKFGIMASSDTHVTGGSFDENNFWSKVGILDATPESRGSIPPGGAKTWEGVTLAANADDWFSRWSAAGLAGVWAEENTREAIFAALRRKETFATSGPRLKVRFFAGFGWEDAILDDPGMVRAAYDSGVPMGGDLIGEAGTNGAPALIAWAVRDPNEAPLERLQIVKVWVEDGARQEKVFDVACADGAEVDGETNRCPGTESELDLSDCSISTEGGDPELKALWRDPEFEPTQYASYYVRVLQVPTCRWSTWDALRNGTPPNPDLPVSIQERAWSSPIWYVPPA